MAIYVHVCMIIACVLYLIKKKMNGKMVVKYLGRLFSVVLYLLTITVSSAAYAATFTDVYIFGDSLSDTNTGLSNGDLWPVYFAPQVGATYDVGNNYAVAGATTGHLASQVSLYQADATTADPNALYVVWAGANDISLGFSATDAANNLINTVNTLSSLGASNFLVPNMPDLGLVPAGAGSSALTDAAILFNSTIDLAYSTSTNVLVVDIFELHHSGLADPTAYGLTNMTDSCLYTGADCSTYFFWDNSHPTTFGHSIIANEFASAFVPIPAAVWLFGSGLIGLVGLARSRADA